MPTGDPAPALGVTTQLNATIFYDESGNPLYVDIDHEINEDFFNGLVDPTADGDTLEVYPLESSGEMTPAEAVVRDIWENLEFDSFDDADAFHWRVGGNPIEIVTPR